MQLCTYIDLATSDQYFWRQVSKLPSK